MVILNKNFHVKRVQSELISKNLRTKSINIISQYFSTKAIFVNYVNSYFLSLPKLRHSLHCRHFSLPINLFHSFSSFPVL